MDTHAPAQYFAQEKRAGRARTRGRPPKLAECLLYRARAVLLCGSTCGSRQSVKTVRLSTGELYAGDPPVQFGGRGSVKSAFPTPIPLRAFPDPLRQRLSVFSFSAFLFSGDAVNPMLRADPIAIFQWPAAREQESEERVWECVGWMRIAPVGHGVPAAPQIMTKAHGDARV